MIVIAGTRGLLYNQAGKKGDYIMLDMLASQMTNIEMSLRVSQTTARLLQHCVYESSVDATRWVSSMWSGV